MGLSKELMERILSNLGLKSKDVGVSAKENILPKRLKLEEEDYSIKEYMVYGAECHVTQPPLKVAATDIGTDKFPDLIVAILQDNTLIALKYSFQENDSGAFMTKYEDKWVDMTVLAQLNLVTASELITQNGFPWVPAADPEEMFSIIAAILSEDN